MPIPRDKLLQIAFSALLAAHHVAATPATGDHVCAGYSADGPATMVEAAPEWSSLPCTPDFLQGGTGRGYGLRVSLTGGATAWVYCPSGTGWALRWGAWTWPEAVDIVRALPAALAAPDKRSALQALETGRDIASPELKAIWCPHWATMRASHPIERWVVAPAAANAIPSGTRPAYPFANGTRGSASNGRATAGAPCRPSVGRIEGSTAYFGVNNRADQVAVCVKVSP